MPGGHGTDTEVGRLRTVLVHRPGAELSRITPGNAATFPCGRVPWLSRAQAGQAVSFERHVATSARLEQPAWRSPGCPAASWAVPAAARAA